MTTSAERAKKGTAHVQKAADHQRAARNKMCGLLMCLLVLAAVLLIYFLAVKK